ncbi:hypothetical protein HanIR_Chr05g0229981 [Helianthus annuus]|nr:hypothetical protein HanIR_Chr05g0229981 [Helianthus annuus]
MEFYQPITSLHLSFACPQANLFFTFTWVERKTHSPFPRLRLRSIVMPGSNFLQFSTYLAIND